MITDADHARITGAIYAAEQRTAGEIVCVVARGSSSYVHVAALWAAGVPAPAAMAVGVAAAVVAGIAVGLAAFRLRGAYFAIGDRADWSYLLPARLGRGRYVLDAIAIDGAGNRTPLARGTTRVVFTVR